MANLTPQQAKITAIRFYYKLLEIIKGFIRALMLVVFNQTDRFALKGILQDRTGVDSNSISMADEKYFMTSWAKWGQIIDYDLIDQMIYKADKYDCDNFAGSFSNRAAEIYELNTCGIAYGSIYNAETDSYLGEHAFNIIVTYDNGKINLICYEPMTDGQTLITKNKPIIINNLWESGKSISWRYLPKWLIFN